MALALAFLISVFSRLSTGKAGHRDGAGRRHSAPASTSRALPVDGDRDGDAVPGQMDLLASYIAMQSGTKDGLIADAERDRRSTRTESAAALARLPDGAFAELCADVCALVWRRHRHHCRALVFTTQRTVCMSPQRRAARARLEHLSPALFMATCEVVLEELARRWQGGWVDLGDTDADAEGHGDG